MWLLLTSFAWAEYITKTEFVAVDFEREITVIREFVLPPYDMESEDGGPYDCNYAGMEDKDAGVRLTVVNKTQRDRSFTIYAPARRASDCTPMAESKAALSEAKAYMAELGLELNKLPPVVMPNENDEFVFKAGTLGMQTRTDDPYMKELEKRTNDGMQAFEVREELWNSVVFSRAYRIVELAPGGGEFERNVAAVSKGKKVILLRRTGYHDMRAGSESESHVLVYDFTTPPPLKEGPKPPMPTLGTAVYDSVEVLGYNPDNTMFAYRIIAHHEPIYDQVGVSIDCRYGGQKEFPTSGVTLHAASLAEPNTVTSFTVYAAAPTPEDCTSRPAAEEGLAKAKAHFKQLGIDIGRSPKRILPTGEPQVLALGNGDTFSISPGERISAGYLLGKRLVLILEPSSYEPFRIEALE